MTDDPSSPVTHAFTRPVTKDYQGLLIERSLMNALDALPESVLILNKFRQIVYINQVTLETFGVDKKKTYAVRVTS